MQEDHRAYRLTGKGAQLEREKSRASLTEPDYDAVCARRENGPRDLGLARDEPLRSEPESNRQNSREHQSSVE